MISVSEAKHTITANCKTLSPITIPLKYAAGLVLAKDVFATEDIPSFNQSAMDGYAFCFNDWQTNNILNINGEVQAGTTKNISAQKNEAIRIFTGAAIPENTDTVVMQEKVIAANNLLTIHDELLKPGSNVRLKGSEIKKGELALKQGSKLSPAAIGFLASIGIMEVCVYPTPKIIIVITGNELQQPGETLQHGQVYESNSFTLKAVLQQMHINNVSIVFAKDNAAELKQILATALTDCKLLLITGGVSVGDYDFVTAALEECGVKKLFHKIKQKPGKPLYAGITKDQIVFGLPGNPSSVLTCFYEYVVPAIEQMMRVERSIIQKKILPLEGYYQKKAGLTHFLKAHCNDSKVSLLNAQESYRLSSFATANCLLCLSENETTFQTGDMLEVHVLPY
ncbi:molybdopterin molybdenumtransferase [mine drainage metagenome]|uniref:Molybdopterin molybdenumtransferase n=1 Tax=mine drainage metagenome TaxID=410659 RepID=A0A1J5RVY4_9ZZZZ